MTSAFSETGVCGEVRGLDFTRWIFNWTLVRHDESELELSIGQAAVWMMRAQLPMRR
jgi:hypothetical protein